MMRAIRFATQLDFRIEEKSLDAITENAETIKDNYSRTYYR